MLTGFFVLFNVSPLDMCRNIFMHIESDKTSLKDNLDASTKRKKQSYLKREILGTTAQLSSFDFAKEVFSNKAKSA